MELRGLEHDAHDTGLHQAVTTYQPKPTGPVPYDSEHDGGRRDSAASAAAASPRSFTRSGGPSPAVACRNGRT